MKYKVAWSIQINGESFIDADSEIDALVKSVETMPETPITLAELEKKGIMLMGKEDIFAEDLDPFFAERWDD